MTMTRILYYGLGTIGKVIPDVIMKTEGDAQVAFVPRVGDIIKHQA